MHAYSWYFRRNLASFLGTTEWWVSPHVLLVCTIFIVTAGKHQAVPCTWGLCFWWQTASKLRNFVQTLDEYSSSYWSHLFLKLCLLVMICSFDLAKPNYFQSLKRTTEMSLLFIYELADISHRSFFFSLIKLVKIMWPMIRASRPCLVSTIIKTNAMVMNTQSTRKKEEKEI